MLLFLTLLARHGESLCLSHHSLPQFPQPVNEVQLLGAMPGGAGIGGGSVAAVISPESDGVEPRFQAVAARPKRANSGVAAFAPALCPCGVPMRIHPRAEHHVGPGGTFSKLFFL